jgi:hypothetical protein
MNLNTRSSQTVLGIAGLALTIALAQAAPPAHAPAHGYRDKKGTPPPRSPHAKARLPHPTAGDIDGDGIPNGRDNDMDGDGIPNHRDRQPRIANHHQKPLPKKAHTKKRSLLNKMGVPDKHDPKRHARHGDIDKDGIANRKDKDIDGDGIRNKKDRDRDGDGIRNKKDDFDRRKNRK